MRRAAKRDSTEREIIDGLRRMGASVEQVSRKDFWDLVVGWDDTTYLLEVKRPGEKASAGQKKLHARWKGGPNAVVSTLPESLLALGVPLSEPVPVRWTEAERAEFLPAPRRSA